MEKRYYYITDDDYLKAEMNGIKKDTVRRRVVHYGWDVDRAITEKAKPQKNTGWSEWKDKSVVCYSTYLCRINNGMTPEQAATTEFIDHIERYEKEYGFTKEHFKRAAKIGVDYRTVVQRYLKLKWDVERCVSTPKMSRSEAASYSTKKRREDKDLNSVWK